MEDYYTDLDEVLGELQGLDSKDDSKRDELVEEAEGFLEQIKIHMASIRDPAEKKEAQKKSATYEKKLKSIKRKALLGDGGGAEATGPKMSGVDKSKQGLDKLTNAKQMLVDTEEVGNKVLSDLSVQKEVIKRSTQTMKETNKELTIAQKLANKMGRWWRA
mmetsp:Transcript_3571/g.8444  ORF Transcript_3571/g.8444 Transcript_3571/m.8444 type:complete len:161 (-) Transcript_3571:142-624(-)